MSEQQKQQSVHRIGVLMERLSPEDRKVLMARMDGYAEGFEAGRKKRKGGR